MLAVTKATKDEDNAVSLDELSDLSIKYEALEQKYKTMELENNHYKQHIVEIEQQNEEFKNELFFYKEKMNDVQFFSPMLETHISSIEIELNTEQQHVEQLRNKLYEYSSSILKLKTENKTIKRQKDKLQIVLENNNKQRAILKQIHNNTINSLQDEIEELKNEIYSLKTLTISQKQCINSPIPITNVMIPALTKDDTLRITHNYTKTSTPCDSEIDEIYGKYGLIVSPERRDTVQFIYNTSEKQQISDNEHGYEYMLEQMEDIRTNLKRVEMENAELIKKLNEHQDDEKYNEEDGIKEVELSFIAKILDDKKVVNKYENDFVCKYMKWLRVFESGLEFGAVAKY